MLKNSSQRAGKDVSALNMEYTPINKSVTQDLLRLLKDENKGESNSPIINSNSVII